MSSLLNNLGLDWKLFLAQAVNFLIVLVVLRAILYRPLIKLLAKRRHEIEAGILKSKEADARLHEIGEMQKEKLQEADAEGTKIVKLATERAKTEEARLLGEASKKEAEIMERAKQRAEAEVETARAKVESEAAALVKHILLETVKLAPEHVDEVLIAKVAKATANQNVN